MKTIIKIAIVFIMASTTSQGTAQNFTLCAGSTTVITATNSSGLSNPSYSLNPGGITSPNPTFAISPISNTTYTLYVTGTNSNSAVVTTSNTVTAQVSGVTYSLVSPQAFTLGCASKSVCDVQVTNATSIPITGAPITYTFLPPGSSAVIPAGPLGSISSITTSIPGTWSVVVRDNVNFCTSWSTVNISTNTTVPSIGNISVSHDPLTCTNPTTLVQTTPNPSALYEWFWAGTPGSAQGSSINVSGNSGAPTQSVAVTLTLQVTDPGNLCLSSTVVPVYQNLYKPVAAIGGPSPAICMSTVVLTNVSVSGIPGWVYPITQAVVATLWQAPAPQPTAAFSSTYVAHSNGVYTMTVRDNNNGCMDTATFSVSNIAPAAAFVHTVTGGSVVFNNVSSGTAPNASYFWDFGDGTYSTLEDPTHTYLYGGAHPVKLKVMNAGTFCADSIIQSVTVSGIPCSANSGFSMVPTGTAQVWNVVPLYPWNITAARWDWGDGSSSNALYTSHQYAAAGMYNICLSVTVSCVASSSTCATYSVYRATQSGLMIKVNVVAPELKTGLVSATVEQLSWNIVPNPNEGWFRVDLHNASSETVRVAIYDLTGRIVHQRETDANSAALNFQAGHLPRGMYLVSLEIGNLKYTKRMIVNR